MYSAIKMKEPPIIPMIHVISREYCKLWNSTTGSTFTIDDTLEARNTEPLVMAKCEMSDDTLESNTELLVTAKSDMSDCANTCFSASDI
jgi:hypothetical protein